MFKLFRRNTITSVDANDIDKLLGKINLIDIREPYEYKTGHIRTAKNIPMSKILDETDKYLEKNKQYHIVCRSGARSSKACRELDKKGFDIINVSRGTVGYSGDLVK